MRGELADALGGVRGDLLACLDLIQTIVDQDGDQSAARRNGLLGELDRRIASSHERISEVRSPSPSRRNRPRSTDISAVSEALEEVMELFRHLHGDGLPVLHVHVPDGVFVAAHPCAMRAILLRLLQHAIGASEEDAPVQLVLDEVGDGVSVYVAHQSRHAPGYGALSVFERQHLDIDSLVQLGPDEGVSFYALQCLVEMTEGYVAVGRTGSTVTVRVTLPRQGDETTVVLPEPTVTSPPA